jgi:hypothetical protein
MQLGEAMSEDLAMRLTRSSRGRSVTARPTEHTPFNRDFSVSYDAESFSYVVDITPAGLFEEAFRFLERWIARHAAQRDGVYESPAEDQVDFSDDGMYWMLERFADQVFIDLENAVDRYCDQLTNEVTAVPQTGDIRIESRIAALRGLLAHFASTRRDVRCAVLAPHTVDVLRCAGILPHASTDH